MMVTEQILNQCASCTLHVMLAGSLATDKLCVVTCWEGDAALGVCCVSIYDAPTQLEYRGLNF